MVPAFWLARLPLRADWFSFFSVYWIGQTANSIFGAIILFVVCFPLRQTLIPAWNRYCREKARFLFAAMFAVAVIVGFGWSIGLMVVVDGLAITELVDRTRANSGKFKESINRIFLPAAYLFVGLVTVYAYIHFVVGVKLFCAYDPVFNKLDALLFDGNTVGNTAHVLARYLPPRVYTFLQLGYYSMFVFVGGGLIVAALCFTENRAFRYAGAVLMAYYLAIGLFYLFPSIGPFYSMPGTRRECIQCP